MMQYVPLEMHCHTLHSDGNFTPRELLEAAAAFGCKGVALTDHNTDSGMAEMTDALQKEIGVKVIPGIEWTTYFGHMLVLGSEHYVDWRFARPETIDRHIREVKEAKGIVGIAHPFSMGGILYTGGFWEFQVQDWSQVSYIEVWSKGENMERKENLRALSWWESLLSQGHKLALTAGRDWHREEPLNGPKALTYIGVPRGEITLPAIKEALAKGRTYVTFGPQLSISAGEFSLGDTLPRTPLTLYAAWEGDGRRDITAPWQIIPTKIRLIRQGTVLEEKPFSHGEASFSFTPDGSWYRIDVMGTYIGSNGEEYIAMSSPLYS